MRKEINEQTRIKEEFKKINRTGKQPGPGKETKEKRKKREERVSGRSVGEESS